MRRDQRLVPVLVFLFSHFYHLLRVCLTGHPGALGQDISWRERRRGCGIPGGHPLIIRFSKEPTKTGTKD